MTRKLSDALTVIVGAALLITASGWSRPAAAAEPFIGTIKYFGFNFSPRGWALCDGQLLAVNQNDALFSLVGTTYGGDGRTTFGLPDMRGRLPVHMGHGPGLSNRVLGQKGGAERVTLTASQAGHTHTLRATTGAGNQPSPTGNTLAQDGSDETYKIESPNVQMHAGSVMSTGGSQSHQNMPPFLGVTCAVALVGVYPSRN
jgi:microcystin-dependent protein